METAAGGTATETWTSLEISLSSGVCEVTGVCPYSASLVWGGHSIGSGGLGGGCGPYYSLNPVSSSVKWGCFLPCIPAPTMEANSQTES